MTSGYSVVDERTDLFVVKVARSSRGMSVHLGPVKDAVVYQVRAEAEEVAGGNLRVTSRPVLTTGGFYTWDVL